MVVVRKESAALGVQKSRRAGLLYRVSSHEVSLKRLELYNSTGMLQGTRREGGGRDY